MNIWIVLLKGNVYGAFSTKSAAEAAIERLSGVCDINGNLLKPKLQTTFMSAE